MPYYLVNLVLNDKKQVSGIKENQNYNIEIVFRQLKNEAEKHYRANNIAFFNCVMISKQSECYKEWIRKKQYKKGMLEDFNTFVRFDLMSSDKNSPVSPDRRKEYDPNKQGWGELVQKQNEAREKEKQEESF